MDQQILILDVDWRLDMLTECLIETSMSHTVGGAGDLLLKCNMSERRNEGEVDVFLAHR